MLEGSRSMRLRGYALTVMLMVAVVAAVAVPEAARAQPFRGFYVNLGAGYGLAPDVGAALPSSFTGSNIQLERNGGFTGLGSLGYAFGNGFRLELEGSYRQAGLNGLSGTTAPASVSGNINNYGLMGNVLFDMDIGMPWLYPYLGGGVGYGWDELSSARFSQGGTTFSPSGTSGGFAWQAIAGLSFPVSGVPGLSVTAEYRYHSVVGDETFHGSTPTGSGELSL